MLTGGVSFIALASAALLFRYRLNSAWLVLGGGFVSLVYVEFNALRKRQSCGRSSRCWWRGACRPSRRPSRFRGRHRFPFRRRTRRRFRRPRSDLTLAMPQSEPVGGEELLGFAQVVGEDRGSQALRDVVVEMRWLPPGLKRST